MIFLDTELKKLKLLPLADQFNNSIKLLFYVFIFKYLPSVSWGKDYVIFAVIKTM